MEIPAGNAPKPIKLLTIPPSSLEYALSQIPPVEDIQ